MLVFLADHEAGDVLQEHQWDAALGAQFDEMRALLRRFGEQDAVVGDEANRIAIQPGEAGDQCGPVTGLESLRVHSPQLAAFFSNPIPRSLLRGRLFSGRR